MPTFGSLFSGIGGMDLGLERAGWECKWQVEIDDWRRQVLTRHWPEVPKWKDVSNFPMAERDRGRDASREANADKQSAPSRVDLICGGFPCQDLSVAGRRAGLAGDRSGLFFEFARIIGELKPQWLLIENVPGLLSSAQGLDFAIVLNTLDELGYGVAWRILNSQFFGVPQRRRRVFIVGHLGGPCPPEILFESEGGGGNPQTGGKTGESVANPLGASTSSFGGQRYDLDNETYIADGLTVGTNQTFGFAGEAVAAPLEASDGHHGYSGPRGDGADNLIAQPLRSNRWGGSDSHGDEGNVIPTLDQQPSAGLADARVVCIAGNAIGREPENGPQRGDFLADGTCFNLTTADRHAVCTPADPDGVRETAGTTGRLDSCSRCPDGRRYAALGDAVTVPVAEWIGRRILRTEAEG